MKENNSGFTYPLEIDSEVLINYENHSRYWENEPQSMYANLPACPHARIVAAGNMGGVTYKEFTGHGSKIIGSRSPSTITATLAKQCLYNSKIGDQYIDAAAGTMWICTAAGTESAIGTWTQIGAGSTNMNPASYREY